MYTFSWNIFDEMPAYLWACCFQVVVLYFQGPQHYTGIFYSGPDLCIFCLSATRSWNSRMRTESHEIFQARWSQTVLLNKGKQDLPQSWQGSSVTWKSHLAVLNVISLLSKSFFPKKEEPSDRKQGRKIVLFGKKHSTFSFRQQCLLSSLNIKQNTYLNPPCTLKDSTK